MSFAVASLLLTTCVTALPPMRPPAVPLVTVDPYFSVWSFSDHLYDSWPNHWTGAVNAMAGMIRIDGKPYRFMGPDALCPDFVNQTALEVRPTQTMYTFQAAGAELKVTFTTPMLPNDYALISRPVTYLTFEVHSTDGKQHDVALYFDATAEWCVNKPDQKVTWERSEGPEGLALLRFGSLEQPVLEKKGDNIRIDWGYFYVATPKSSGAETVVAEADLARKGFRDTGAVPKADDTYRPRPANEKWPVLACGMPLGQVEDKPVARHLLLAYDDVYSIEYMHKKLLPWWRKTYPDFNAMLAAADKDYLSLVDKCAAFDASLVAAAEKAGGPEYARLIAMSYRHVFASGKPAIGPDGGLLFFHKECFSNGCIATVDVSYPASPFFALFAPEFLKGMTEPIFEFAASDKWTFPFAPHDVGTYPKANGQVYSAGKIQGQMPVEECGNMIIMAGLAAVAEGNAKFAEKYWKLLTQWAEYLKEKGLNPENQLCTDDFAGHLAHNTNLSLKAINALGAYGMLCGMLGKPEAAQYKETAKNMAAEWVKMASDDDHYRLTFDKPGTWSMKYNLVWDPILKLGLFPEDVAKKEIAYYLKIQNKYGLPLDNRKDYTKSDWLVWCATMASNPEDFQKLIAPLYLFCNETKDRCPFTDWYDTKTAKCVGFRARPVIGGIFIKLLAENGVPWQK